MNLDTQGQALTSYDTSSLMIDRLYDQAAGENATVACFYFDFAARKEQSPTNMLGAVLKQVVRELREIPKEIKQAYEDQKRGVGGWRPRLTDIVRMLQAAASENPTFICIDGIDECLAEDQANIFDSLNRILWRSPGTRVFMTGRPQIQPEVERHFSRRAIAVRIIPPRDDIVSYLQCRLGEDKTPDAMDSSLEGDILKRIPDDISEMWVE